MKTYSKPILNIFTFFILLFIVISTGFTLSAVEAESLGSPLYESRDFFWAKRMGGTAFDYGKDIAVDSNGNVYTTGAFSYTADFNPGPGTSNLTSVGTADIFLSKLDSDGKFIWAKNMGSALIMSEGNGIAVDLNGNVFITGAISGVTDFDPGEDVFNLTGNGGIFVAKFDGNGNFVWAKDMGGTEFERGNSIAVDLNGNVYTTGLFGGMDADFDPGPDIFILPNSGTYKTFVSKLDNNGNFVWAKSINSGIYNYGNSIAVDSNGEIYATGIFLGTTDFDPGPDTLNLISHPPATDIYILKLNSDGSFVWAKSMGGTDGDWVRDITLDTDGNIYTTGYFRDVVDFDPSANTFTLTSNGYSDIFISKLGNDGRFIFAKNLGGIYADEGFGIEVDSKGNIFTTGYFSHTADFDPGIGTSNLVSHDINYSDIFISKLDKNGDFIWAEAMGGENDDIGRSIALDFNDNIYTTGDFSVVVDFDPGTSIYNMVSTGSTDIFISKTKSHIFTDVPLTYWANNYIERLYHAGITGGCGVGIYCPDATVTRAQMAVFLLKGMHGSSYIPPAVGITTGFGDVAVDYWAAAWIKQLAAEGITSGCGGGNYCPESAVTRAQMAIFLLKAKYGSSYSPPNASGVFTDVPVGYWSDKWIEQLAVEGVTSGCGNGNYCPDDSVTRAQMAVFLVKAFNLP